MDTGTSIRHAGGVEELLRGILDYAGLFPPAALPFDEAVRTFGRHRRGGHAWMLGGFVCPAARLAELEPHRDMLAAGEGAAVIALGRPSTGRLDFLTGLEIDLALIAAARRSLGPGLRIGSLETRLPAQPRSELSADLAEAARAARGFQVGLALEVPLEGPLAERLERIAEAGATAKYRTGGTGPEAIPEVGALARGIFLAARAGLALKCTAGLHHPVRGAHSGGSVQHGFLNVVLAGILARRHGWAEATVARCIGDEDPTAFVADGPRIGWREWLVDAEAIRRARSTAMLSFGCCSFEEPVDGLQALGWL